MIETHCEVILPLSVAAENYFQVVLNHKIFHSLQFFSQNLLE